MTKDTKARIDDLKAAAEEALNPERDFMPSPPGNSRRSREWMEQHVDDVKREAERQGREAARKDKE